MFCREHFFQFIFMPQNYLYTFFHRVFISTSTSFKSKISQSQVVRELEEVEVVQSSSRCNL